MIFLRFLHAYVLHFHVRCTNTEKRKSFLRICIYIRIHTFAHAHTCKDTTLLYLQNSITKGKKSVTPRLSYIQTCTCLCMCTRMCVFVYYVRCMYVQKHTNTYSRTHTLHVHYPKKTKQNPSIPS